MKKLLLASLGLMLTSTAVDAQNCSDLFISKYCSMAANNKCIEVYNPTANPIVLNNKYYIARYKTPTASSNTSGVVPSFPNFSDTLWLKGTVQPYSTWVICNPENTPNSSNSNAICDPNLQAHADQLGNIYGTFGSSVGDPTYFKGSDAITIEKKVGSNPAVIVDIFGRFGDYMAASNGKPSAWSTKPPYTGGVGMGQWVTKGYMMVRKSTVMQGVTTNPSVFNPLQEYDTIQEPYTHPDTLAVWNLLGSHNCDCKPAGINDIEDQIVAVYPNPAVSGTDNTITVESDRAIQTITVYTMEGVAVVTDFTLPTEQKGVVVIGTFPRGIYIASVLHKDGVQGVVRFSIQ